MKQTGIVIIGAGVIGLSIAYKLSKFTPLEKAADFNRRSLPLEANGGLKPLLAQTVRERSSLTGFTSDIIVLERNDSFGRESSSRNSEVIHSGLYYLPGSLKAQTCIEGNRRRY